MVCELDCVACSTAVFLSLCFASSVVWAVCQKSGFWWRCSCLSAGSVCRSISIYVWNFKILCTYLTIQLKGMQTIKMNASINTSQLVTTNTPKPWRKYDSQRHSRCLCHHREITPYYGMFVIPQTAAREVNRRGLHSDWCEETTR